MAIVQEFDLNMIPDSAPVIVHVNQYDEGEGRFEIHLYDGNVPYVPAAGAEAIIQGTKPDGKGFDYNATLSGSTVTADVTKQMTAVAGIVRAQIVITEGDDVTGTFVFGMDVQRSGLPADTDMSESDYQVVEQMIEAAEEAEEVATQSAEDAEAWAVGQRSGEDVPSTDPTYHNNSKYWAGKAHEELENKADLVGGKVPSSELPSYVDDVIEGYYYEGAFYEDSSHTIEIGGEVGKIYVDLSTNDSYRWSGSAYVRINDVDLTNYIQKSPTTGLIKNDGTVDTNTYATTSELANYIQKSSTTGLVKNDGTIDTTSYLNTTWGTNINSLIYSWQPGAHYKVGDYCNFTSADSTYGGRRFYKCKVEHTAEGPDNPGADSTKWEAVEVLNDLSNKAPQSMIGDAWVTSHAYAVGDYCIDGNVLYKCKTAHTSSATYRPPYASYWDAVSVASELSRRGTVETIEDTGDQLVNTVSGTNRVYQYSRVISSDYFANIKAKYRYLLVELLAGSSSDLIYPVNSTLIDTKDMKTNKYAVLASTNNFWVDLNKFIRFQWVSTDLQYIQLFLNNSDTTGSAIYMRGIVKGII